MRGIRRTRWCARRRWPIGCWLDGHGPELIASCPAPERAIHTYDEPCLPAWQHRQQVEGGLDVGELYPTAQAIVDGDDEGWTLQFGAHAECSAQWRPIGEHLTWLLHETQGRFNVAIVDLPGSNATALDGLH